MITRRGVFFMAAASVGAASAASRLATTASAAPASLSPAPVPLVGTLDELRADNNRLRATLDSQARTIDVLLDDYARLLHRRYHPDLGELKASEALAPTRGTRVTRGTRGQYHCSFCGKSQDQVRRLIAGPAAVYICDECVGLCREIIGDESVP